MRSKRKWKKSLAKSWINNPAGRRINQCQLLVRLAEQGGQMLALEGERGALWVVLVIDARRGRIDNPG